MQELKGNLWDEQYNNDWRCITTNGIVKNNGNAVMGKGCAKEAAERYPQLPSWLGLRILKFGNKVTVFEKHRLIAFPVKNHWKEKADPELIKKSAEELTLIAEDQPTEKFILPRPGCGSGGLKWNTVQPLLQRLPDNVFIISFDT